MNNPSATIIAAIIGAIAVIGAAVIALSGGGGSSSPGGSGGGGGDNGSEPVDSQQAEITVSVPPSNSRADITVTIEGEEVGMIYTHQEPHEISTSQFTEGEHSYSLQAIQYSPDGYSSRTLTGSGTISVEDGKEFQVFTDLNDGTLYLQPMS
jgi:hypothetical protein